MPLARHLLKSPSVLRDALPSCADLQGRQPDFPDAAHLLAELAEVAAQYPQETSSSLSGTDLGLHFSKHLPEMQPTALILDIARDRTLKRIAVEADAYRVSAVR